MLSSIRPKNRVIVAYLFIPVVWFVFAVFVPLMTAFVYSFFEWKGGPQKTFIGIENYITLIKDSVFWGAFGHNIYLVVVCIIGQIGIAFIFSLMITSKLVKFKTIHRTFGFFPSTVSAVAVGFIWKMIYDYKRGMLNWLLEKLFHAEPRVWLDDPKIVMLLVSIPLVWQFIGYYMLIIFSALASVDKEIFEVAEIDGASSFQSAIYIVLPLIKNTLLVCLTLCIAGNMKVFDNIYVMTEGGPGYASNVMAMYGYNVSFKQSNMGYGSAISIGIFVLSMLVIGGSQILVRVLTKDREA